MAKHRKLLISVLLLAAVATAGLLVYRRISQPPELASLLPEGDRIFYLNLRPVHLLELNKSRPVQLDDDYRSFVDQTGIQFERDLEELAMSRRDTTDGRDVESSEIFSGRFDAARLQTYLQKISTTPSAYRNHLVYSVANEGHMVRVCILDKTRIAVTNMPAVEPMQSIIDKTIQSSRGPELLEANYRNIPATSIAWMIDRIPPNSSGPQIPGGLSFSFLENTTLVASLRYSGNALFRAEVYAASESEARRVADSASSFLAIYRGVSKSVGTKGMDADVKAALDSIHIEQKGNVATLSATFSQNFLKEIASEVQPEGLTGGKTPEPLPEKKGR